MEGALVYGGAILGLQGSLQLLCSQLGQQERLLMVIVPLLVKQLLDQPRLPLAAAFCASASAGLGNVEPGHHLQLHGWQVHAAAGQHAEDLPLNQLHMAC